MFQAFLQLLIILCSLGVWTKTWTKIERTRHEQINSKRKNALKLLDQYDSQLAKTSFELGISKHTKIVVRQKKEK